MTDLIWAGVCSILILAPLSMFSVKSVMSPLLARLKMTAYLWGIADNDDHRQQHVLSLSRQIFVLSAFIAIPIIWVGGITYTPIAMDWIKSERSYYWGLSGIILSLSICGAVLPLKIRKK